MNKINRLPSFYPQTGSTLFIVLAIGIIMALVLMAVLTLSGKERLASVKNVRDTKDFYLADAGFNFLQSRVTDLKKTSSSDSVEALLSAIKGGGWQKVAFGAESMGYFRLKTFAVISTPFSVELTVEGSKNQPGKDVNGKYESVHGWLRAPSLARYARYVEGNSTLSYSAGTRVHGEVLAAGGISLQGDKVHFTRLVSTGATFTNKHFGLYDFGLRENQEDIPTLNHVHINTFDKQSYVSAPIMNSTFESYAKNGGIWLYREWTESLNGAVWSRRNASNPCSGNPSSQCDTLFAACFDEYGVSKRSPVVVAGSAVAIDLSKITFVDDSVAIMVNPVIYDAGGAGKDFFVLGTPAKREARKVSEFNGVIYFPGDIYLTGKLKGLPVTIVSGDDVFLSGSQVGPDSNETDAQSNPVTLGIVVQDRIYVHESSSKDLTIRAAALAENDEITYTDPGFSDPYWKFGYVCKNEVFHPDTIAGLTPDKPKPFSSFFGHNFIWDNNRVSQAGFGREPDEECEDKTTCANQDLDDYGFVVLGYARSQGDDWKFLFDGSLITRQPSSKGPKSDCNLGWDCDSDPDRTVWKYDDNLGVAEPPKFPAPQVDDKTPSQIFGFKRKSR